MNRISLKFTVFGAIFLGVIAYVLSLNVEATEISSTKSPSVKIQKELKTA